MQQQQPNPIDALKFLDGILAKVAGSRQDHAAIQGALGVVAKALQPEPSDADKRVGHELQG